MKIIFLTQGNKTSAGSRTRVFQYLPHLNRDKIKTKVIIYGLQSPPQSHAALQQIGKSNRLAVGLIRASVKLLRAIYHSLLLSVFFLVSLFYDVVFIQKVLIPPGFIGLWHFFNKKVVFDFDDSIFTLHHTDENSASAGALDRARRRFESLISKCDLVSLENDFTQSYVEKFNKNILKIAGPIDTDRYKPVVDTNNGRVTIGWIGSRTTTIYLMDIAETLKKIKETYGFVDFLFIGADKEIMSSFAESIVPWSLGTEQEYLSKLDIGLMPLRDDEWTRGKGGYKILQYMASGIPSVASPVEINRQLIIEGANGYLANTASEWADKLALLIKDTGLRKALGTKARVMAEEKYSFYVAAKSLVATLKQYVKR